VLRLLCTAVALAALAGPAAAASETLRYSGVGGRTLAPFRIAYASTLRWQTSGGLLGGTLAVKVLHPPADMVNPQLVFTRARTGSVALRPGRYTLRVDAVAGTRWQITIA
jgi:hypothetical protein